MTMRGYARGVLEILAAKERSPRRIGTLPSKNVFFTPNTVGSRQVTEIGASLDA
jgi:hypothetical protein